MIVNFPGIYLFSDIDGTLGIAEQDIPKRNVEAIQRFVRGGGNFSLATGRCLSEIAEFTKDIPINMPCIVNNGCAIYDFENKRFVRNDVLPDRAMEYLREILREYPDMDLLAVNESGYYHIARPDKVSLFPEEANQYPTAELDIVAKPYHKFLFLAEVCKIRQIVSELNAKNYSGVQFIQSSSNGFEMLPKGRNKGAALLDICRMLNIPVQSTVFIGDNYNDREIFETAGFSACVSDTPSELQTLCDIILGSCMNGAVADLIERLERNIVRVQVCGLFNNRLIVKP